MIAIWWWRRQTDEWGRGMSLEPRVEVGWGIGSKSADLEATDYSRFDVRRWNPGPFNG